MKQTISYLLVLLIANAYVLTAATVKEGLSFQSNGRNVTVSCGLDDTFIIVNEHEVVLESIGDSSICMFEFPKLEGSSQLKVEFLDFSLDPPSIADGGCNGDTLRISGSITVENNFPICGPNTYQKIYLSYGYSNRITLAFITLNKSKYKLRVSHVQCGSSSLAPPHCLQNLESIAGTVKSFSYGNGMITGHSYTICVQEALPSRLIEWSECDDAVDGGIDGLRSQFFLSNNFLPIAPGVANVLMGMTGRACDVTSFVEVFGEARHCGAAFRIATGTGTFIPVQSRAKPYMLFVNVVGNGYPVPSFPATMVSFPYLVDAEVAPNPIPKHFCMSFGTATTGAQGFSTCTIGSMNRICSCSISTVAVDPSTPPRTGFCLKYVLK